MFGAGVDGRRRCGKPSVGYIVPPINVYPDLAVIDENGERRMYLCAEHYDLLHDPEGPDSL
jgi:hypothetical protein